MYTPVAADVAKLRNTTGFRYDGLQKSAYRTERRFRKAIEGSP